MHIHHGEPRQPKPDGILSSIEKENILADAPRIVAVMVQRGLVKFASASAMPKNVALHLERMRNAPAPSARAL